MKYCFALFLLFFLHGSKSNAQISLQWVNATGLSNGDRGFDIKIAPGGDIYVIGTFGGGPVDFDPSPAVYTLTALSSSNLFVARYTPTGSLVWAIRIGGPGSMTDPQMAFANNGDFFLVGTGTTLGSIDFDPTSAVYNVSPVSGNMYMARYTSSGTFVWALAGAGNGAMLHMDVNLTNNNIVLSGKYYTATGTDLDFSSATYTVPGSSIGAPYCFLSQYDQTGAFQWGGYFASPNNSACESSAIRYDQATGNIFLSGGISTTTTVDMDITTGVYTIAPTGGTGYDAFIAKYNSSGNIIKAIAFGQPSNTGFQEVCRSFDIDASGDLICTGDFVSSAISTADFDPGAGVYNLLVTGGGGFDIFYAKYDSNLNLVWAKAIGSSSNENSSAVKVDNLGYIYLSGAYQTTLDVNPAAAVNNVLNSGSYDIFTSIYDNTGTFVDIMNVSGTGDEHALANVVDNAGNFYLTGYFSSANTDFDPQATVVNQPFVLISDYFIAKYKVTAIAILPLNITNFNAGYNSLSKAVDLTWRADNSHPGSRFDIQQSDDAIKFNSIGSIITNGFEFNSAYNFTDKQPSKLPVKYYRIVGYENEQPFYSEIIQVKNNWKDEVVIYPNPARDLIFINGINPNEIQNINLYNNLGQAVSFILSDNKLITTSLKEGVYSLHIKIKGSEDELTRKIVFLSGN